MEQEFRSKKIIRRVEQEGKQGRRTRREKARRRPYSHHNAERKGEKQVQEELEEKISKIPAHCRREHQNGILYTTVTSRPAGPRPGDTLILCRHDY
jgi:hypothetical protein